MEHAVLQNNTETMHRNTGANVNIINRGVFAGSELRQWVLPGGLVTQSGREESVLGPWGMIRSVYLYRAVSGSVEGPFPMHAQDSKTNYRRCSRMGRWA